MRRSLANARAAVPERPVLPRPRRRSRLGGVIVAGCLLGLFARSRRFFRNCYVRLLRRVLPRTGAPGRTQELFGRGSAFSFWIRPEHCTHVPYGVWFERCTPHMVQGRSRSWKGCASNAFWAPARQAMQLAGSTRTSTTLSSTCSVRKSSETSSCGPCYSFGPQRVSRSLGQEGGHPKWPSGWG